jgi:hypothetical protein
MAFPNSQAESVSWDDTSIGGGASGPSRKMERFKAQANKNHRILIMDASPVRVFQHYKKDFGYVRCLKSLNQDCAFCNGGDKAAEKYGVNVLVYPDNVTTSSQVTAANVKIATWLFGAKTFAEIRNIKQEWGPLDTYDLKITCTNEQFQHLVITPAREALYVNSPDAADIRGKMQSEVYDLKKILGRTSTPEEVKGIYEGTLSRDDVFKKRDGNAPAPGTQSQGNAWAPQAPEEKPKAPQSLNLDALLGR